MAGASSTSALEIGSTIEGMPKWNRLVAWRAPKRWLGRGTAICFVLLLTEANAFAARRPVHIAVPGYQCTAGKIHGDESWGTLELDTSGQKRRISVNWRTPYTSAFAPRLSMIFIGSGTANADPRRAALAISLADKASIAARKPRKRRLELTTDPGGHGWPPRAFAGTLARASDVNLLVSWPDAVALARGSERLFVVMRDKEGAIVTSVEITSADILRGQQQFEHRLGELASMQANYKSHCRFIDDLEEEIIL